MVLCQINSDKDNSAPREESSSRKATSQFKGFRPQAFGKGNNSKGEDLVCAKAFKAIAYRSILKLECWMLNNKIILSL
jgi:hypothetical protein